MALHYASYMGTHITSSFEVTYALFILGCNILNDTLNSILSGSLSQLLLGCYQQQIDVTSKSKSITKIEIKSLKDDKQQC